MRIALDARALTSTDSGIENYTLNLARALLEEDKALELLLVCTTSRRQRRLHGPRIQEVVCPFPARSPLTLCRSNSWLRGTSGWNTSVGTRVLGRPSKSIGSLYEDTL